MFCKIIPKRLNAAANTEIDFFNNNNWFYKSWCQENAYIHIYFYLCQPAKNKIYRRKPLRVSQANRNRAAACVGRSVICVWGREGGREGWGRGGLLSGRGAYVTRAADTTWVLKLWSRENVLDHRGRRRGHHGRLRQPLGGLRGSIYRRDGGHEFVLLALGAFFWTHFTCSSYGKQCLRDVGLLEWEGIGFHPQAMLKNGNDHNVG